MKATFLILIGLLIAGCRPSVEQIDATADAGRETELGSDPQWVASNFDTEKHKDIYDILSSAVC